MIECDDDSWRIRVVDQWEKEGKKSCWGGWKRCSECSEEGLILK